MSLCFIPPGSDQRRTLSVTHSWLRELLDVPVADEGPSSKLVDVFANVEVGVEESGYS